MSAKLDELISKYGESHQNKTNKAIHWICVPAIMFSLFGLLYAIPFPFRHDIIMNWAFVVLGLTLVYYASLSLPMFLGFIVVAAAILIGNHAIFMAVEGEAGMFALISVGIFVLAWIGQFIGHHIEGKKPSFFDDVKFLLIGPVWLLHFIYKRIGLNF